MKLFINFSLLLFISMSIAQQRKVVDIQRFDSSPKIDGIIDDKQWKDLIPATKFERWMPNNGASEKKGYENYVYLGYDDNAIYVGARLNNPNPIPVEFSQRDNIWQVNAELFFVSINTYDDNTNYQSFQVTSAGTQGDRYTSGQMSQDDQNFDTVFESKVSVIKDGWSIEMKIPYSALRFPSKDIQNWGINFGRKISETGEVYTWNLVDITKANYPESMGITSAIKNISPPLRLFFYPYLQSSIDVKKGNKPLSLYSAGMDVKYGISNSFTLDATLIPDFGQVTFDDKELNLSPFEQKFDENRAFFTEGASLFKKGDSRGSSFFYSRRIGDEINFDENDVLKENEKVINYDGKPDLLNSIKITGTTNSGLSIGFINSITNSAYVRIINNMTGETRKEEIAPLTNYNILTLSQQIINEYSTLSLSNTNVHRTGNFNNSNNSALIFDLFDNKRTHNIRGNIYQSDSPSFSKTKGFRGSLDISELTGNLRFGVGWSGVDRYYYQNDLGYYNTRNDQRFYGRLRFQTFNATDKYEKIEGYFFVSERSRFFPKVLKSVGARIGVDITTPKLQKIEFDIDYTSKYKNFDEPRSSDVYIMDPAEYEFQSKFTSDRRKKIQYGFDLRHSFGINEEFNEKKKNYEIGFGVGIRVNNKLNLEYETGYQTNYDDIGYVFKEKIDDSNDNIYFGNRNVEAIENNFSLNYNFDSYMSINLKLRQFWSAAKYLDSFYLLKSNGERENSIKNISDNNPNTNFNLWNFDLGFNWEFAPGSKATLLYRNNIFNENNLSGISYYNSTKDLFKKPLNHQLSLRINYFIDYNLLKKKKS